MEKKKSLAGISYGPNVWICRFVVELWTGTGIRLQKMTAVEHALVWVS